MGASTHGELLGLVVGGVLPVLVILLTRGDKAAETAHGTAMFIAAAGVILVLQ